MFKKQFSIISTSVFLIHFLITSKFRINLYNHHFFVSVILSSFITTSFYLYSIHINSELFSTKTISLYLLFSLNCNFYLYILYIFAFILIFSSFIYIKCFLFYQNQLIYLYFNTS